MSKINLGSMILKYLILILLLSSILYADDSKNLIAIKGKVKNQNSKNLSIGRIISLKGRVFIKPIITNKFKKVKIGEEINNGDFLKIASRKRHRVCF